MFLQIERTFLMLKFANQQTYYIQNERHVNQNNADRHKQIFS
jgi:hypothetical protein